MYLYTPLSPAPREGIPALGANSLHERCRLHTALGGASGRHCKHGSTLCLLQLQVKRWHATPLRRPRRLAHENIVLCSASCYATLLCLAAAAAAAAAAPVLWMDEWYRAPCKC